MAIALIFPGQGAQAVGMGKSLCDNSPQARALFTTANDIIGFDLASACFDGPAELLTETRICQPALYVHGLAVVETLKAKGKSPDIACACGLSLGELTALRIADVYDFATGLRIVAERGRLMQECCEATEGAMTSLIGGSPEAARELAAKHDIDVGNYNCPGQIVLSGAKDGIAGAMAEAKAAGFKMAIALQVAGAYHSRLMQPAADQFAAYLKDIEFAEPAIPVYSNVTGAQPKDADEIKTLLVQQVTSPVRWEDCFRAVIDAGVEASWECGPGNVLAGLAKRIDRAATVRTIGEWADIEG